LKENVRALEDVTVINKAIGAQRGMVPFYSGANPLIGSTKALRAGGAATVVEVTPLSEFIRSSVDLLKVDVEGAESDVLAELEASGKLSLVREMFVEYHHHISGELPGLASFLGRLERCGFDYELDAKRPRRFGQPQDILIRATRNREIRNESQSEMDDFT
jgi:hypothetical protein